MAKTRPRRWHRLRLLFRWCRIALLLVILAGVVALIYLTTVGVPQFLRARIQSEIRAHGLNVTFERLRYRWYRGFVADTVRAGGLGTLAPAPQVEIGEITVELDWPKLWHREIEIHSVGIRDGRVVLDLAETNQPPFKLDLDGISTHISFQPQDHWDLDELEVHCLGMKARFSGTITNALALRRWQSVEGGTNAPAIAGRAWRAQLRQFVRVWEKVQFTASPDFRGTFQGDARDPASFVAELRVKAAGAQADWGSLENFNLIARLNQPRASNGWFHAVATLDVANAHTRWGRLAKGRITASVANPPDSTVPAEVHIHLAAEEARNRQASFAMAEFRAESRRVGSSALQWQTDLDLSANAIHTAWADSSSNRITATLTHSLTNWIPSAARASAHLGTLESRWGSARNLEVTARTRRLETPVPPPAGAWWTNLAAHQLELGLQARDAHVREFRFESLSLGALWSAPSLTVSNLAIAWADGEMAVPRARFNVDSGALAFELDSTADFRRLTNLWPAALERVRADLDWSRSPSVRASVSCNWPGRTDGGALAWDAMLPSLAARASIRSGPLGYRDCGVEALEAELSFTNQVLEVPRLHITRPEGQAVLSARYDLDRRDFHARFESGVDLQAFRSLAPAPAAAGLALLQWRGPPGIEAEVRGRIGAPELFAIRAGVVATNLVFRSNEVERLEAGLVFTNRFLLVTNVSVKTASESAEVAGLGLDLRTQWLYLTNARSHMDPMRIARAINQNVVKAIQNYRFDEPPQTRVNGHVPIHGSTASADMTFEVDGGPFHYWRFDLPHVASTVHWTGDHVTITNLAADFYGGRLGLDLWVDLQPRGDADFRFDARFQDVLLGPAVKELTLSTNQLQGLVNGTLNVTSANSADWRSWQGSGNLEMRNGYLWDFPVFLVLSKLMNVMAPGIGNSRASAGKGTFLIRDSVIHTDDLQIRATPLRLACRGTIDFDGNVNGWVEAEVLRDTPLIGPLISFALSPVSKALTYRVTNTLGNPRVEPVFVPSFLRSILGLSRTPAKKPAPTEPPPVAPPPTPVP